MRNLLLYIAVFGFLSMEGYSQKIEIIMSSDAGPFVKIANSYEIAIKAKGMTETGKYNLNVKDAQEIADAVNLSKPDFVITIGTKAAKMANEKLSAQRRIYTALLNPEEFMASEICGISLNLSEEEKFTRLAEYFGSFRRCGVFYSAKSEKILSVINVACKKLGIAVVAVKINNNSDLTEAIDELKGKVDFLYMVPDIDIYNSNSVEQFLKSCVQSRIPVVGLSESYTKGGALISFDCDYSDIGLQTAILTETISKKSSSGCKETPRKVIYYLNGHIAEHLGIILRPEILSGARLVY